MQQGAIIWLNGPSSLGKSSTNMPRAMQKSFKATWLAVKNRAWGPAGHEVRLRGLG
jgi:chloramphenicol 3-O-phosphotransferase